MATSRSRKPCPRFVPDDAHPLYPELTDEVEFEMEVAARIGCLPSELDERMSCRDFNLLIQFFRKYKRFPGDRPS